MSNFKLKDLQLGNLDAKNELIEDTDDVRDIFINSYVIPPNFNFQKFYERQRYFITGLKGTGKTALLRYISIKLEEDPDTYSKFILFKSDLGNKDISAGLSKTNVYDTDNINEEKDYKDLWRWFIYSEIVFFQNKKEIELFQRNNTWSIFSKKVLAIKKTSSLFPKIKNGNLSISLKLFEHTELSAQLGFDKKEDEIKIDFKEYIYEIDELFEELESSTQNLNIFFDELELNYIKKKQYKKDANLIKDLILSIEKINGICRRKRFNVFIYSAIRSEVLLAISGDELNKSLSDFGESLSWYGAGNDENQPLLNVITKRLAYQLNCQVKDVWSNLFPPKIQRDDTRKYILHHSWYRPRDIVRFLTLAQKQGGEKEKFEHEMFDSIQYDYSSSSWNELVEELRVRYSGSEINGIQRIFNGFKEFFTYKDFEERITYIRNHFSETENEKHLLDKDIKPLLEILYRIGFIGNVFNKFNRNMYQFSFRGNPNIDYEKDFIIHKAVKRYLGLK
ncbi:hypothetical protein EUX54_01205 [Haemophilus haemolyticus]|jgi:hypothetical protein|uniref:Uncharacterized protein n=2 Tax=Haemophilus TaxID=724 RepID=A0A502JPJ6_HAEHA|nr:hypothetical protein [Haemophilus haemolyticus]TPH01708.1 hypothetical protein EUX54_01205 [Haemophilus haemolyticus]